MSNLTKYVMIMTVLVVLFYFGGLVTADDFGLLELVLDPENFQLSDLWTNATTALQGLALTAGVIIGAITRNLRTVMRLTFATYLGTLFINFIVVYQTVAIANRTIAIIIFAPLLIVWIITLVEWGTS